MQQKKKFNLMHIC